jgi:hypothetical protein
MAQMFLCKSSIPIAFRIGAPTNTRIACPCARASPSADGQLKMGAYLRRHKHLVRYPSLIETLQVI